MESIYFVMSWLCHRKCVHCYEDRFHPYHGEELQRLVAKAVKNVPRIIDNFPERMTYRSQDARSDPRPKEAVPQKRGRIIMAGGEILLEAVRESVLYPAIAQLKKKYESKGGVELIVQTTGDILTPKHVTELLHLGVDVISISGMDAFHEGLEHEETRERLMSKLRHIFADHGMEAWVPAPERREGARYYHFFGATPESWIGKLWPRGRAWQNELSTATIADNFCNAWSGGLNFLRYRDQGSEVSVDPEGNVFPCCLKTKLPAGNILTEPLEDLLDRLAKNSVYRAISLGQPELMGVEHGWSVKKFLEKSTTTLPSGRIYQNLCIGCDSFHEEVLSGEHRQEELVGISGLG